MQTMLKGKVTLLFMVLGLVLAVPTIALADNLQDSVTAGSNAKTIATGTANAWENKYWIEESGSGSDIGPGNCDIPAGGSATFKLNVPNGVTATSVDGTTADGSPKLVFSACGDATTNTKSVTFSSNTPGVYNINALFVSGTGGVTDTVDQGFNENPANLRLTVAGVTSVSPADGATGVPVNSNITATFSQLMDPGTLQPLRLVKDGTTTTLPASLNYTNIGTNQTASWNPVADLEYGTKYNVTIVGGANGAKTHYSTGDMVALEDKTWSFTTVAPACTNPAAPVFQNTTPDGSNGWFTSTPTVSATSSTSGAVVKYSDAANGTFSNTAPTLDEGTTTVYAKALSSTGTCSSAAVSHTYKIDTIAPEVNPASVIDNVWRNSLLSETFAASDGGSGLANPADASFMLTTSGDSPNAATPVTASKTVSDNAGNSSTRTISAFVDSVKPSLGITDNNAASAGICSTSLPAEPTTNPTDALSGIKAGSLTTNWVDNTAASGLGTYTYSASVLDNAGNKDEYGPKTYSVVAGSAYGGVQQPINLTSTNSSFKLGSTVPVKFTLGCGAGKPINNSVAKLYLSKTDTTAGAVNEPIATNSPDIGNQFRVTDTTTGQYQFNLSTKAGYQVPGPNGGTVSMSEGTWYLYIQLDGGDKFKAATFDIKK